MDYRKIFLLSSPIFWKTENKRLKQCSSRFILDLLIFFTHAKGFLGDLVSNAKLFAGDTLLFSVIKNAILPANILENWSTWN